MDNKQLMKNTFTVETNEEENNHSSLSCVKKVDLPDCELITKPATGDYFDRSSLNGKTTDSPHICEGNLVAPIVDKCDMPTIGFKERCVSSAEHENNTAFRKSSDPTVGSNVKPVLHETKSEQRRCGGQNYSSDSRVYYNKDGLVKYEGDGGVVIAGKQTGPLQNGPTTDGRRSGVNNKNMLCGDVNESPMYGDNNSPVRILTKPEEEMCVGDSDTPKSVNDNLESIVVRFMEEKHGENPVVIPCESDISDDLIDLGQKKSPFKRLQPPLDALPGKPCLRTPSHSFKIFETGKDPLKTKSDNQNAAEVELVAMILEHRDSCRTRRFSVRKRRPDLTQDEINLPDIMTRAARPKSQKILRSLTTPFRRVKSLLTGCIKPKAM